MYPSLSTSFHFLFNVASLTTVNVSWCGCWISSWAGSGSSSDNSTAKGEAVVGVGDSGRGDDGVEGAAGDAGVGEAG